MLPCDRDPRCKGVKNERIVCELEDPPASGYSILRKPAWPTSGTWEFRVSRLKISIVAFAILTLSGSVAASQEKSDPRGNLPPPGSVKLSQLIAETEGRPGFHAVKSISYSRGEYAVVYYMKDGAEVKLNFDVKTGGVRPPSSGGLFGG